MTDNNLEHIYGKMSKDKPETTNNWGDDKKKKKKKKAAGLIEILKPNIMYRLWRHFFKLNTKPN